MSADKVNERVSFKPHDMPVMGKQPRSCSAAELRQSRAYRSGEKGGNHDRYRPHARYVIGGDAKMFQDIPAGWPTVRSIIAFAAAVRRQDTQPLASGRAAHRRSRDEDVAACPPASQNRTRRTQRKEAHQYFARPTRDNAAQPPADFSRRRPLVGGKQPLADRSWFLPGGSIASASPLARRDAFQYQHGIRSSVPHDPEISRCPGTRRDPLSAVLWSVPFICRRWSGHAPLRVAAVLEQVSFTEPVRQTVVIPAAPLRSSSSLR